jgi:hypothetical protein
MLGTEKQVYSRIYMVCESIEEVNAKIQFIKENLKISDAMGNDMILEWLKPFNEDDYK